MQLPSPNGRFIFQKPSNKDFHEYFDDFNIWKSFNVLNLVRNHRQGNYKRYAELLNRMRVGKLTTEDVKLLKSRVRPNLNHPDIPDDALHVFCTNKEVNHINEQKLEINLNEVHVLKADHICDTQQNFRPTLQHRKVKNTPCVDELRLKVGAEVMLTHNLDVCDSLANGSKGTVIGIKKNQNGKIRYIIVQFHDNNAGKERRKTFPSIVNKYPDNLATPIEKLDFSYSLSKKAFSTSTQAKVIQFPLCLGYSISGHKSQGQTIKKPRALVTDLRTVWPSAKALAYVICSRVESLEQLFILGDLPLNKIIISKEAKEEMVRLNELSINRNPEPWYKNDCDTTKISCLNIRSLPKHIEDVRKDHTLLKSDLICLTQTCLFDDTLNNFDIEGYHIYRNNMGNGKGIAIYAKPSFSHVCNITRDDFQMIKMSSNEIDVICIYRSSKPKEDHLKMEELHKQLMSILTISKPTLICGDFNICIFKHPNNYITKSLFKDNFNQIVKNATHEKGGLIDHVYIKNLPLNYDIHYHSVYYSDHDGICITIGKDNQPSLNSFTKRKDNPNSGTNEPTKNKKCKTT